MIRKGILKAFDGDTYKASVQVIGSLSVWLDNVTVSAALNRADMVVGRSVVLLSLDPSNPDDCILVGLWGVPQEPSAPGAHENTHTDGASDEIDSALDPRAYPLLADTLANRPAAGVDGRFFWTTDEHILYRDNGTNWVKAAVADHADLDGVGASDHHAQFENVVEDTTPQLGGDLDAQNHDLNNVGTLNVTHISAAGGGYDFNLQGLYYFHLLHNGSIIFNVTPMDEVGKRSESLIPLTDDTYDLGQTGAGILLKRWRNLYLSGSIIGTGSPDETLKLDAAAGIFYIDTINEITNNAGVTVEGVLLKDSEVDGVNVSMHYDRHEVGGDDELYLEGLSGELADPQPPKSHASDHQNGGSDEISVAGLSGELADAQTPKAHASDHQSGGSDAIKLDDLAAPDDNTDLDASTSKHGLLPKLPNDADKFLDGAGSWTQLKQLKDADGDTKVDVEESSDEDIIRMDVAGTEAFNLGNTGILTLDKQSAMRSELSADQTINNATPTKLSLDTEIYDVQNEYNTNTYRYTATVAGKYIVTGCYRINIFPATSKMEIQIRKNGSTVAAMNISPSLANYTTISIAAPLSLAVNDYVELWARQDSGDARDVIAGSQHTNFSIIKVA